MIRYDLVGRQFGELTVISKAETRTLKSGEKCGFWKCKCSCGNTTEVRTSHLVRGIAKTCGAGVHNSGENNPSYRHGARQTKLYPVWNMMRQRCNNPNNHAYKNYGGRGISVCKEWNDFANFYKWSLDNGYSEGLTIDRIDTNGNYEPKNCRWITMEQQQNNRRNNVWLFHNGATRTIKEWSEITGIPPKTIHKRIHTGKWSVEEALSIPCGKGKEMRKGAGKHNVSI